MMNRMMKKMMKKGSLKALKCPEGMRPASINQQMSDVLDALRWDHADKTVTSCDTALLYVVLNCFILKDIIFNI